MFFIWNLLVWQWVVEKQNSTKCSLHGQKKEVEKMLEKQSE